MIIHAAFEESGATSSDDGFTSISKVAQISRQRCVHNFQQVHYTFNLRDFSKVICGARGLGDGHQPNNWGLYTHYKDSLLKVG